MVRPSHPSVVPLTSTMLQIYFLCMFTMSSTLGIQVPASGHNSLLNKHVKVAAEPWSPFIIFYCNGKDIEETEEYSDKCNMTYGGALWELLKLVKLARNVTFSILRPPTPTWGFCHGVNNCTGMIGMVNRREVDFALGVFMLIGTVCSIGQKNKFILKYFSRAFHTNPKQGTSCRFYNTNWSNGLLHHNCSTEVPGQFVVNHRSIVIQSLDLFPDLHSSIYCGNKFNELSL